MFRKVNLFAVLLLTTINVKANGVFNEEGSERGNYQYSSRSVTVETQEQGLEIFDHTTGQSIIVDSYPDQTILRTPNNIFRARQHYNFAGAYNAIEVFRGQRFVPVDLGGQANRYNLAQAYVQNNTLFLTMRDGSVSFYNEENSELLSAGN